MGLFSFFKKKSEELTEEQRKWDKMWDLWFEEKIDAPYSQLMRYQSEINNGGHDQYFINVDNTTGLHEELPVLESILPALHKENLHKAYKAYLVLEEKEDDEQAAEILAQCDNFFYEKETVINDILAEYAKTLEL